MALKLKDIVKGIECEYWKICRVNVDILKGVTFVDLMLYFDSSTRNNDVNNFLKIENFCFAGVDFTVSDLYNKIKNSDIEGGSNKFVNSEDV